MKTRTKIERNRFKTGDGRTPYEEAPGYNPEEAPRRNPEEAPRRNPEEAPGRTEQERTQRAASSPSEAAQAWAGHNP